MLFGKNRENKKGYRLSKEEMKEKIKRHVHVVMTIEMKQRMDSLSCPKCGKNHWIKRGPNALHRYWVCDECGYKLTKWGLSYGKHGFRNAWWIEMKRRAIEENKRKKQLKGDLRKFEKNKL